MFSDQVKLLYESLILDENKTVTAWNKGRGANKDLFNDIETLVTHNLVKVISDDKKANGYRKLTITSKQ
jgi:hypothetical protein